MVRSGNVRPVCCGHNRGREESESQAAVSEHPELSVEMPELRKGILQDPRLPVQPQQLVFCYIG